MTVSKESLEEEEKKDSEQASATDFSELEKYVVAPRMFKYVVSKGHQEFSSGRFPSPDCKYMDIFISITFNDIDYADSRTCRSTSCIFWRS